MNSETGNPSDIPLDEHSEGLFDVVDPGEIAALTRFMQENPEELSRLLDQVSTDTGKIVMGALPFTYFLYQDVDFRHLTPNQAQSLEKHLQELRTRDLLSLQEETFERAIRMLRKLRAIERETPERH